jgi:hypothetical protein
MPTQPFLALITPLGATGGGGGEGGYPSHPWVPPAGHPSHPWVPPPGYPSHPWVPPAGHPSHPWVPPGGHPSHPWVPPPGYPSHPWVPPSSGGPGTPPLGIWGGGGVGDYIDAGFPGPQPGGPIGIWGGPYFPPVIWDPSRPTNPIVNPGDPDHPGEGQPGGDRTPKVEWKTAWSPSTGWVVVGVPTGEHPTPSGQGSSQSSGEQPPNP